MGPTAIPKSGKRLGSNPQQHDKRVAEYQEWESDAAAHVASRDWPEIKITGSRSYTAR
jgi:hypothetical protein